MTFSVYGPASEFTNVLTQEFSRVAKTAHATSVVDLQAQNAANIIVVSPFHDKLPPHFGKKILHIKFIDSIDEVSNDGTYFIYGRVNFHEAAQVIVKRFVGFESGKGCVICPPEETVNTAVHVITVSKETTPSVGESTQVLTPVTHINSAPSPKRQKRTHYFLPSKKRFALHVSRPKARKPLTALIVLVIWFLFLPYALLLVSGTCSLAALKSFPSRRSVLTTPLLHCGRVAAGGASTLLQVSPFKSIGDIAQFLHDSSLIALDAHRIYIRMPTISAEALTAVSPDMYKLSRDIAILASKSSEIAQLSLFSKQAPLLLRHASLFQVFAAMSSQSPDLLGKTSPKTYAVLLQNNMELRPTGGFIGSFLLIDVDNGEVTAQKIYDVYDADGQITGFVKPPEAIVNYLGEASWHLRDSNWDPDFEISAKRAIWFLDKSLNRRVDGVIGVNLEVLRTLIQSLGPIEVPDYGGTLTSDNFYATIQSEVHKEFFPGSRKKSNYLTAVFNAVLFKLNQVGSGSSLALLTGIIRNLDARDIQIYSTNEVLQNEFNKAGIAGAVSVNSLGFVEANVGVNKSNQYIERAGSWQFEKEGSGNTTVTGKLELTNIAQPSTDETRYRVYIRTFAPKGSSLMAINVNVAGKLQAIVPEMETLPLREQAGAFIELKAGEKALVTVTWSCPPSTDISIWKQGGVLAYPISVSVLTGGALRQYNTTFGQDEHIQL